MKCSLPMGVLLAVLGGVMTSCTTWTSQSVIPFHCVVQSATDSVEVYEITLDGELVASGRTVPKAKGTHMLEFTTTPGSHVLTVTAPGCEPWEKKIAVLNVVNYGQTFLVELKKSQK